MVEKGPEAPFSRAPGEIDRGMTMRCLLIDGDAGRRAALARGAAALELQVLEAADAAEVCPLAEEGISLVVLALDLPGDEACAILATMNRNHPAVPVVVLTDGDDADAGLEMMRRGASDFLPSPLEEACGEAALRSEVHRLRKDRDRREGLKTVVGTSPPMRRVYDQVRRAASSRVTVTLVGEPGTGKELLARALHHEGPRRDGPFVTLDCAAVPPTLIEATLFGRIAHAGTAGAEAQCGHLMLADGGTLYLERVSALPAPVRERLVHALQHRAVVPVGGDRELAVDVRLVAGTNRDLGGSAGNGQPSTDLCYRISAYPVRIPPLRDRRSDVPQLAYHFLAEHREAANRPDIARIEDEALRVLGRYGWPGNVQELEQCIGNALLASGPGAALRADALPDEIRSGGATRGAVPMSAHAGNGQSGHGVSHPPSSPGTPSLFHDPETGQLLPLRKIEERAFRLALEEHGGNTTRAAKALGVARATFYRRLKSKRSA
jgi:DNA-binding NtrC family response regulator